MAKGEIGICANCGEEKKIRALGLCKKCYDIDLANRASAKQAPPKQTTYTIDFKGQEALLAEINRASREQFRPLEWQIMHTLKIGVAAQS